LLSETINQIVPAEQRFQCHQKRFQFRKTNFFFMSKDEIIDIELSAIKVKLLKVMVGYGNT
jgi:hypothetical protein